MGAPTVSRTNSNFLTSSAGVTTVNLRNLGDSRTLVLVTGRRFVSGVPGDSAVDLNTIPTDFIERVELLTGGASATYGSDAVAGVLNIILKKNFNGALLDSLVGQSEEGDDFRKKLGLTFGITSADGASNLMGTSATPNRARFFRATASVRPSPQRRNRCLDLRRHRPPFLCGTARIAMIRLPKSTVISGSWLRHNGAAWLSVRICCFFASVDFLCLQGRQRLSTVIGRKNNVSTI